MDWLDLLRAQVEAHGLQAVGDRLGYSKATLSLVLNGKYPSPTSAIEAKVRQLLDRVACPHLQHEISGEACRELAGRACSTSDPYAIRQWAACEACPLNPTRKGEAPHAS